MRCEHQRRFAGKATKTILRSTTPFDLCEPKVASERRPKKVLRSRTTFPGLTPFDLCEQKAASESLTLYWINVSKARPSDPFPIFMITCTVMVFYIEVAFPSHLRCEHQSMSACGSACSSLHGRRPKRLTRQTLEIRRKQATRSQSL